MGERVYAQKDDAVWTVLYIGNTAELTLKSGKIKLKEETKYPWEGDVQITVEPEKPFAFDLNLRVPGWCDDEPAVTVNGEKQAVKADKGYLHIARTWKSGDVVKLSLPMPVRRVYADPHVKADEGRVALQRGPVVYCLEGVDNDGAVRNLVLPKAAKFTTDLDKDLLGGVVVIKGEAQAVTGVDDDDKPVVKPTSFVAVPYCTWDNRKPGPMVVWLPERPELAEPPGDLGTPSSGVRVRASHVWQGDMLAAVNDGVEPKNSNDHSIPRHTWWDHRGGEEWIAYRFSKPRKVDACAVYWFDDTGVGQCRTPAEWRLLWRDGDEWKPVKLAGDSSYGTALDQFNKVSFEPVTTRELKIEATLKKDFSGGVLKWTVPEPK
jgi:uncharacterized protein